VRKNLEKIRKEKGVSLTDIADLLDLKSSTVREKIDGKSDFKFGEAKMIKETFFPEYDMIFLFTNENVVS
jgi:transcriptional regulator with XRE-family HTH domain